ncbi:unnamed protein product [Ceutorhynchus assimilis]|uniref:FHA domain-containing protein n=1 Tax=Ceutorhynchus assimilis TaxID=467358 RepID=A0A9N9QNU5_9CUCU|nr:unnamed protein product [Ceutorhynchus assimilis]
MVVVSGNWVKNVAPYLPQTVGLEEEHEIMAAKAILICRPNSHHFQERTLTLDQPIKVGRSVARAKPTSSNAIFDCKVLSRHHALLWHENGKFYLQDTKSSNGTFVNNNKLSSERQEVCFGDIVQFGVDVVENNRKVTHGCIIATLNLYLPDGKPAKASPSITEGESHGVVPIDDLYRLNQYLQEASQREQCLESKLNALRNVVEETKRSAEESWQAYVGEERLLSRLSALETQLQQARTNWSEDRLKEEIAKLRDNNEKYQEAAKQALEKVHAEKQEAVVSAMEQERAKISAEQDALLAREQLELAQLEIQEIAQKLNEIENKCEDEKQEHEKQIRELEQHLEEEEAKINELEAKIYELTMEVSKKHSYDDIIERPNFFENDLKIKEEILAENEIIQSEAILNKSNSNGFEPNHISLTVVSAQENYEEEKTEDLECESDAKDDEEYDNVKREEGKRVSFNLSDNEGNNQEEPENSPQTADTSDTKSNFDQVDSKTLKYQYQSAQKEQKELKQKIETLEKNSESNKTKIIELNKALIDEKQLSGERLQACASLREELASLEQKWQHGCNENRILIERVNELVNDLEKRKEDIQAEQESRMNDDSQANISCQKLMELEEELVLLKEKYAQSCEEKVKLQRDVLKLKVQHDLMCNNMYNKCFWYVCPLVIIVLYLLISKWIS